jgi:hypothetical protein
MDPQQQLIDSVKNVIIHSPVAYTNWYASESWWQWLVEPVLPSRLWLVTVVFCLLYLMFVKRKDD